MLHVSKIQFPLQSAVCIYALFFRKLWINEQIFYYFVVIAQNVFRIMMWQLILKFGLSFLIDNFSRR